MEAMTETSQTWDKTIKKAFMAGIIWQSRTYLRDPALQQRPRVRPSPQVSYRMMILYAVVHSSALRVHLRDGNKSSVVVTRADVI